MRIITIILLIFLFSISAFSQSGVKWEEISLNEAISKIKNGESDKKFIFLYFDSGISPDSKWIKQFEKEVAGNYFNDKFLCIKADATTREGKKLQDRLKSDIFPKFMIIDDKGEVKVSARTFTLPHLIMGMDKKMAAIDPSVTFRHIYNTTKDTAIAYQYIRLTRLVDDPNSLGAFVSEFFNELTKSPNFWNVYKSALSIEAMSMIDWTLQYRKSFRRAAPIEQIEKDLADLLLQDMKTYIAGNIWGNKATMTDAGNYIKQLKTPSKLDEYIMAFAVARAEGDFLTIKQLCTKQSLTQFLTKEEILAVKDLFISIKEISDKDKEDFLKSIKPLIEEQGIK